MTNANIKTMLQPVSSQELQNVEGGWCGTGPIIIGPNGPVPPSPDPWLSNLFVNNLNVANVANIGSLAYGGFR